MLAMTNGQEGNKNEARKWYGQAVQWMNKNAPRDEDLERFREAAAALLDVKKQRFPLSEKRRPRQVPAL
jgi:hypothetical protein